MGIENIPIKAPFGGKKFKKEREKENRIVMG